MTASDSPDTGAERPRSHSSLDAPSARLVRAWRTIHAEACELADARRGRRCVSEIEATSPREGNDATAY